MMEFKSILFPTDFSPAANRVLDYAISLALEHESPLILGQVVQDIDFNSPFTLGAAPATVEYRTGIEGKVNPEIHKAVSPQPNRSLFWGQN
jgi:nucleotide-binding universal stress UspA family protein